MWCALTPSSGSLRTVMRWEQRPGELLHLRGRIGLLRCVLRRNEKEGTGQRLWTSRGSPSQKMGAGAVLQYGNGQFAQHPESFSEGLGMLHLCHTRGCLPSSHQERGRFWCSESLNFTVLPKADCTEQGPDKGNALNPGKGFTWTTRIPHPAFHIFPAKLLSLAL